MSNKATQLVKATRNRGTGTRTQSRKLVAPRTMHRTYRRQHLVGLKLDGRRITWVTQPFAKELMDSLRKQPLT